MERSKRVAEPVKYEAPEAQLLDLAAERKRLEREEAEAQAAELVDLLTHINNPEIWPHECALWGLLIEMVRPKNRMGRFLKVESQVQAEQYLTVVGRVLQCGPVAMEGKTESGIPLNQLTATIKTPEQLIGKYVIIQRYTGNDLYFAPMPGKKLRYITVTEILGVTTVPSMWMKG